MAGRNGVFIITGTSKGIGRALAERYLDRGAVVAGCSRGDGSISHGRYEHHRLDVGDEKAVVAFVRGVGARHGSVDVLLNNAGTAKMNHLLLTPGATCESILRTNVTGTFLLMREAAKIMSRKKYGRIVNFTTVAVPLELEGEAVYAASKAAVECLTRIAAKELAGMGITVNAVGPVPVKTDLVRAVPRDKMDALLQRLDEPRFGTFDEVGDLVDGFLGPDMATGQVRYMGGVGG